MMAASVHKREISEFAELFPPICEPASSMTQARGGQQMVIRHFVADFGVH
jgi:hypothetical protein